MKCYLDIAMYGALPMHILHCLQDFFQNCCYHRLLKPLWHTDYHDLTVKAHSKIEREMTMGTLLNVARPSTSTCHVNGNTTANLERGSPIDDLGSHNQDIIKES